MNQVFFNHNEMAFSNASRSVPFSISNYVDLCATSSLIIITCIDNCYTFCSPAVENDDYVIPVPFEVTFDIMSTSGSLACINISIPQDSALEGDHQFTIHLFTLSPDVVTIDSPVYATIVIADDESKCVHICIVCAYDI